MKNFKFYAVILAAITAVSLTGCGTVEPSQSNQTKTSAASEETTTEAATEAATEITTAETTSAPTEAETTEAATEKPTEAPTEAVEASGYKAAYLEHINTIEDSDTLTYELIHIDDDDIPELAVAKNGYHVSLYTYADGMVHTLMDQWSYGAMGNAGYEYAPKMNSIRNYNSDYAGLIRWTAYASNTDNSELEWSTIIESRYFDDKNGNNTPDEDEPYSENASKILLYVDDGNVEITADEAAAYNVGEYEYIIPEMTLDEIKAELS